MKKILIIIIFYLLFSIFYFITGLDLYGPCFRSSPKYETCLPIAYAEYFIQAPTILINKSPIKFGWTDEVDKFNPIRAGNNYYGGLKIGSRVIFQTWKKFYPI